VTAATALTLPALFDDPAVSASARHVFETLGTARAIRHLRTDPVSTEHIDALIWAATRASSADNSQPWQFVVVSDAAQRGRIAEALTDFGEFSKELAGPVDATSERTRRAAMHLQEHLAETPVLLFVCGRNDYPSIQPQERYLWSAVFGATQNIVVAARALGLSAVFTMLHVANPGTVREVLGVPAEYKLAAMLAVGWPAKASGPVTRRPLDEVVHRDRW
jgi:nitroreductase